LEEEEEEEEEKKKEKKEEEKKKKTSLTACATHYSATIFPTDLLLSQKSELLHTSLLCY